VGIAENVKSGLLPINGLRHPPRGDTTGWYIWAGKDLDQSDNFFSPLHAEHVSSWSILVEKFLALPAGWRFLTDGEYDDVWFDPDLLDI
jgi:hypothetical protein